MKTPGKKNPAPGRNLRSPQSRTRVAEVRIRRMTPQEEGQFTAALDALVLLVAGRVVAEKRRVTHVVPQVGTDEGEEE